MRRMVVQSTSEHLNTCRRTDVRGGILAVILEKSSWNSADWLKTTWFKRNYFGWVYNPFNCLGRAALNESSLMSVLQRNGPLSMCIDAREIVSRDYIMHCTCWIEAIAMSCTRVQSKRRFRHLSANYREYSMYLSAFELFGRLNHFALLPYV